MKKGFKKLVIVLIVIIIYIIFSVLLRFLFKNEVSELLKIKLYPSQYDVIISDVQKTFIGKTIIEDYIKYYYIDLENGIIYQKEKDLNPAVYTAKTKLQTFKENFKYIVFPWLEYKEEIDSLKYSVDKWNKSKQELSIQEKKDLEELICKIASSNKKEKVVYSSISTNTHEFEMKVYEDTVIINNGDEYRKNINEYDQMRKNNMLINIQQEDMENFLNIVN